MAWATCESRSFRMALSLRLTCCITSKAMPKAKIKLNDQQWLKLLALPARRDGAAVAQPGPIHVGYGHEDLWRATTPASIT